jgi:hypothetical protein
MGLNSITEKKMLILAIFVFDFSLYFGYFDLHFTC